MRAEAKVSQRQPNWEVRSRLAALDDTHAVMIVIRLFIKTKKLLQTLMLNCHVLRLGLIGLVLLDWSWTVSVGVRPVRVTREAIPEVCAPCTMVTNASAMIPMIQSL